MKELSRMNSVFKRFAEEGLGAEIVFTTWKGVEDETNESSDSLSERRSGPRIESSFARGLNVFFPTDTYGD